jgi:hypothetical protein
MKHLGLVVKGIKVWGALLILLFGGHSDGLVIGVPDVARWSAGFRFTVLLNITASPRSHTNYMARCMPKV